MLITPGRLWPTTVFSQHLLSLLRLQSIKSFQTQSGHTTLRQSMSQGQIDPENIKQVKLVNQHQIVFLGDFGEAIWDGAYVIKQDQVYFFMLSPEMNHECKQHHLASFELKEDHEYGSTFDHLSWQRQKIKLVSPKQFYFAEIPNYFALGTAVQPPVQI